MSSDVIAEQLSFDAFERALTTVSNAPSTSTRFVEPPTLEESLERVRSHGVVADAADAYGAYVSLTRSGLWRDIAPRRDTRSGGLIYLMCEPRETPTERRKGEPREKRSRSIAVPFAVTRACVTPAFLDVALYLGGACSVHFAIRARTTDGTLRSRLAQRTTRGRGRPPLTPTRNPSARLYW